MMHHKRSHFDDSDGLPGGRLRAPRSRQAAAGTEDFARGYTIRFHSGASFKVRI
jgi:hypothetical protein